MGLADVAALLQADQAAAVRADTWGHLAPKKGEKYPVEMVVAVGFFSEDVRNPVLLSCGPVDGPWDGPWFYDSVRDFISESLGKDENESKIFRFVGHWRNYKFVGKFTQLGLTPQLPQ